MNRSERCRKLTTSENDFALYSFSSSVFCLLPKELKPCFSRTEQLFLFFRAIRRYNIYYFLDKNRAVAFCCVKRNYLHKYGFMRRRDVLINPYYVDPRYRGQGLGGKLIEAAMKDGIEEWQTIWAVVCSDNLSSIITLQKQGFIECGFSRIGRWSHSLTKKETCRKVFKKELHCENKCCIE